MLKPKLLRYKCEHHDNFRVIRECKFCGEREKYVSLPKSAGYVEYIEAELSRREALKDCPHCGLCTVQTLVAVEPKDWQKEKYK